MAASSIAARERWADRPLQRQRQRPVRRSSRCHNVAQSPIDMRTMKRGRNRIHHAREKTGVIDAPIPLFLETKAALDEYLAARPKLPKAPMFIDEKDGQHVDGRPASKGPSQNKTCRWLARLTPALGLPADRPDPKLVTGQVTVDEIGALARHTTREAGEHYVLPDARFVESAQNKRLALRNRKRAKVEAPDGKC
jgi:hypothetical protein